MPVRLTLYTRTDCHLCEDMEQSLSGLASEFGFTTEVIPIDNNDGLEHAYGAKVPVLMFEEDMICEFFLDRVALEKVLENALEKALNNGLGKAIV
jgi:hypothetical protein